MSDGNSVFLNFDQELVVDLFAGGGGASTGIARAYREPDIAVNHNDIAIAVHRANHPNTEHFQADVFEVDPLAATRGRPVGLLWASPDCRHHSKAKGKAPRSKRIRGLAWVVVRWAYTTRARMIEMENVEEFIQWCPLGANGVAITERKGETFRAFIDVMTTGLADDHPAMEEITEFLGDSVPRAALVRGMGYIADWREIRACNKGAPTIRKRLMVKFRRDGKPITWSADTRGAPDSNAVTSGKLKPYRTAAECIDFGLPEKSIFGRKKPLAANTLKRIAKGMWRYVLNCPQPFIVTDIKATGGGSQHAFPYLTEHANSSAQRVFPADEPLRTQVAQVKGGHFSLVAAHITAFGQNAKGSDLRDPMQTALAGATRYGVISSFLEQANGGFYDGDGRDVCDPFSTICASGANQRLVSAYLVKYYGNEKDGVALGEPMHTIPTKDRMGLIQCVQVPADTLAPELRERAKAVADFLHEYLPEHFPEAAAMVLLGGYVIADITLRMLVPRELARAQGFPDTYIIDWGLFETAPGSGKYEWRPVTKTDQVRLIGNSVCPDMAAAEIANDLADLIAFYMKAAA